MNLNRTQEDFLKTANRFGKMRYKMLFHNLSKREYELLTVIARFIEENSDKKGIYVSELAKLLKVTPPAVSRMIGALEEKGYIRRDVNKEDRRNTYVYLTEAGVEAREKSEQRMQNLMEQVMKRMGEKDIKELIVLWNKLADIMEEELEGEKYV